MIEQRESVTQTPSIRRETTQKGRKREKRNDRKALRMSGEGRMRLTRRHLRREIVIPEN